jgi:hypothetical protein
MTAELGDDPAAALAHPDHPPDRAVAGLAA